MKICVAIRPVDCCRKFGMQGNGGAILVKRKVLHVRLSRYMQVIQGTGVASGGRQNSSDASKGAEVGIGELIFARNRSIAGIIGTPRSESAMRGDFPHRL